MKKTDIDYISTRQEYDSVLACIDELRKEAIRLGMFESDMNNEYIREFGRLGKMCSEYEDEYLNILPLREANPLLNSIEEFSYKRKLKKKEVAELLGINESVFSQILSGKRKISISLAKKLYDRLNIDPAIILKYS
ncbi:hypothetical protein EZS27_032827 [termite gut metagenome]|uniref:HTH cro/C1-type domain-containing protein n=1 Tax=termite gut metagenome TaxID=433724 RepID=A0A5J4Q5V2_9ZZZZ